MRWKSLGGSLFGAALVAGLCGAVAARAQTATPATSVVFRATTVDEGRALVFRGQDTISAGTSSGDFAFYIHLPSGRQEFTTDLGAADDAANAVAVDSRGRITLAGTSGGDLAVARYDEYGRLIRSFDVDGRLRVDLDGPDDAAYGVVAYDDGSTLVAGGNGGSAVLLKVLADGTPDAAFGVGGRVTVASAGGPWRGLAVQSDGRIVVAGGGPGFAVARFTASGAVDPSFVPAPGLDVGAVAYSAAMAPDGRIVVGGTSQGGAVAVRLTSSGAADLTLRPDPAKTDVAYGVAVDTAGDIVLAGDGGGRAFRATYGGDGTPDGDLFQGEPGTTYRAAAADPAGGVGAQGTRAGRFWGGPGVPEWEDYGFSRPKQTVRATVRLGGGKILVLGDVNERTGLVRLNADLTVDPSFGRNGRVEDDIVGRPSSVVVLPDGRFVVSGGGLSATLARFLPDGRLDTTFGVNGEAGVTSTYASAVVLLADGRLLVRYEDSLRRYTASGQVDPTFGTGGVVAGVLAVTNEWRQALTVQSDGKILGSTSVGLRRFLPDGAVDSSFGVNGEVRFDDPQFAMTPADVLEEPDGKLLVAGNNVYSCPAAEVYRLNPDGSLDSTWRGPQSNSSGACDHPDGVDRLHLRPDGSVLAVNSWSVVRFHADGAVDAGYGNDGIVEVTGIATSSGGGILLPNGDVIVSGGEGYGPGAPSGGFWLARVSPPAPWAPTVTSVTPLGDAVLVSWAPPPAVPAHAEIRAYEVTATGADGDHVTVTRDGSARRWPVRGLRPGTPYTFAVRALSPRGETAPSAPSGPVGLAGGALMAGWGFNGVGEVGDGTTVSRPAPVAVTGLTGVRLVAAGLYHSLALRNDGTVWAWGWNAVGQLGDGTKVDRARPVQVGGLTDVVAMAAGAEHSLALKADGTVWAWGWNAVGQLGDGTTVDRTRPVQVVGVTGATAIAGGAGHSLAALADGTMRAWGWNAVGQLGDGTTVDRLTPVKVTSAMHATGVAAGWYHSIAVSDGGGVSTWGWNGVGQLGTGTTTDSHVPVELGLGGAQAVTVAAGALHAVVVTSTGGVLAWGWNGYRQVANDPAAVIATPRAVAVPGPVSAVSAGAFHNLAVLDDGSVWGWGADGLGQLGDGGGPDRGTPVRAAGLGFALAVAAGGAHSLVA